MRALIKLSYTVTIVVIAITSLNDLVEIVDTECLRKIHKLAHSIVVIGGIKLQRVSCMPVISNRFPQCAGTWALLCI